MDTPTVDRIRVTHHYDVPIERAFDAWLDREHTADWLFATPDGERVRAVIEPVVGGRFEIVERRNGEDVTHVGRYLEITRPWRLVFTFAVPKFSAQETRVTVDFTGNIEGCTITLMQDGVLAEWVEKSRAGWAMILANLERIISP